MKVELSFCLIAFASFFIKQNAKVPFLSLEVNLTCHVIRHPANSRFQEKRNESDRERSRRSDGQTQTSENGSSPNEKQHGVEAADLGNVDEFTVLLNG